MKEKHLKYLRQNRKKIGISIVILIFLISLGIFVLSISDYSPFPSNKIVYVAGDGSGNFTCDGSDDQVEINRVTEAGTLLAMRQAVEGVHVEPDLEGYIASLVHATRRDKRVAVGASPRGSLALLKLARARAALDGRDYVIPDDIKTFAIPALAHRLILEPEFWMRRQAVFDILTQIVEKEPVPVIRGI